MQCPRCQSTNVNVQLLTKTSIKAKKKTILYWLTIGWLVEPLLWLFLTLPKLIFEVFKPQRLKIKTTTEKLAICQNCGHSWRA